MEVARLALYSSSFTRRMKQGVPLCSGGRCRSTSLTPSLSAIDDCHSYDSATAKHELVYDGVDTDVYVEDLQSGSQEVRGEGKAGCCHIDRRRIERIVAQFWTLFPFFVGWARVGQARQAEAERERRREEYQGRRRRRRRYCAAVLRFSENIYPKIPHSPSFFYLLTKAASLSFRKRFRWLFFGLFFLHTNTNTALSGQWEIERQTGGGRSSGKAAAADSEPGGTASRKSKYLDMVLEVCMFSVAEREREIWPRSSMRNNSCCVCVSSGVGDSADVGRV